MVGKGYATPSMPIGYCAQGWQYGTVRYALMFAKKYGTLVRYAFFGMVRVRYVGTLFESKIPDFSHIAPGVEAKNS